jgi:hypothetical protein
VVVPKRSWALFHVFLHGSILAVDLHCRKATSPPRALVTVLLNKRPIDFFNIQAIMSLQQLALTSLLQVVSFPMVLRLPASSFTTAEVGLNPIGF